jgi:hypothetical protein
MAEGIRVQTCGATWCSGKQGKEQQGVDVKWASSLIWSQGGDCCESDSKLEFGGQKLMFAESTNRGPNGKNRGPILAVFGSSLVLEKSAPEW